MGQPNLRVVQPAPQATANWPDANDVADLLAIVTAQTKTIADNAVLIDRYQAALNAAQAAPGSTVVTGVANSTGTTTVTLSALTGTIVVGSFLFGSGVPISTYLTGQTSGPAGGNGAYTTNNPTTLSNIAVTFEAPFNTAVGTGTSTGTSLAVSAMSGTIEINSTVSGAGIPVGTKVTGQTSGSAGAAGTYTTNQPTTASGTPVAFTPSATAPTWPVPQDPTTLNLLTQQQSAVTRTQTALIQHYQDVLNTSQTPIS
jgi:hypothetical protein